MLSRYSTKRGNLKKEEILRALSALGLDAQEARVYYSACQLGLTSIQKLAIRSELKRTTCYDIVRRLQEQGLITVEYQGVKRFFRAEPPEKLELMLEHKRSTLTTLLPELSNLFQYAPEEEAVKVYQGLTATKAVYKEILESVRTGDEYMVISAGEPWYQLDPKYFQSFTEKRGEKSRRVGFRVRILQEDDPHARRQKQHEKAYNISVKMFPKQLGLGINMVIVPKMVFIHQVKNPVKGFLFTNPYIINLHQQIFEILWNSNKS